MNWKLWKLGLGVALLIGVFEAMVGWGIDLTLKQILTLFFIKIGTAGGTFLAKHPVEQLTDTSFQPRKTKTASSSEQGFMEIRKIIIICATVVIICTGLYIALLLTGCASFTTTQTDTSYEKGTPVRTITTKATASTCFDSKSALSNFKASQTDKTQGASVGSLSQESNGTNAANTMLQLRLLLESLK